MLGRRWLVIWVHSNSLIKNLIPFEDDAEICLLNFLMWSICKQPEDTFINKMASPKIDFYFEVFKQLKTMCWVISQEQHSIKTLEFIETNSYFYSFTFEKNTFSSSSHQWIDFFLWICWQTEKLWVQHQNIISLLEIQTRLLFFLHA